jgi:hypothetical protein
MENPEGYVRPDFLLSYWIFVWFLIYYNIGAFKHPLITKFKKHGSPLLSLWIALFFNVYELIYVMILKFDIIIFIKYVFMFSLIKALPIYLLYRKGEQIHWLNDVLVLLVVLSIYVGYLYANNSNPQKIYAETEKSIVSGNNKTPMFYLMDQIYSFFTKA